MTRSHPGSLVPKISVATAITAVAAVKFLADTTYEDVHPLHELIRFAFLFPVLAGAARWGLGGGALAGLTAAAAYLVSGGPVRLSTMSEASDVAQALMLPLAGIVTGLLMDARQREHRLRLRVQRRVERVQVLTGIATLLSALGLRDEYTRAHSERVSEISVLIATALGLTQQQTEDVRLAGLMHDIGKIGIPDDVLLKVAALTPQERREVERHPALAASVLSSIPGAESIAEIVLCHHEQANGRGYPRRLSGNSIPIGARVVRVADVFCALTEERSYKPGMAELDALAVMQGMKGAELDAASFDALEGVLCDITYTHPGAPADRPTRTGQRPALRHRTV